MTHIGSYAGIDITLDMDIEMNRAIRDLIAHQADELERLKANDFAATMQLIREKELDND